MSDQPLKPEFPNRPFLLPGDYPAPVDSAGDAPFPEPPYYLDPHTPPHIRYRIQRDRREDSARQRQSGALAQTWDRPGVPLTPAESEQERLEDAAYRAQCNGLPDDPADMPAIAVPGGLPFKF